MFIRLFGGVEFPKNATMQLGIPVFIILEFLSRFRYQKFNYDFFVKKWDSANEMLCPLAKILEKDIFPIQVTHHSADRSNKSYGTPKQQPVKPANDTECGLLVFSHKRLHGTAPFGDCCAATTKYCHCFWGSFFFAVATISIKRSYHE
jgi:hypothetical protein